MKKIKTIFFSDVHLGSKFANTNGLLQFLSRVKKQNTPEKIYIVGDFIDGWKLKRNWHWNNESTLIIRKILSLLKKGSSVYYVAGNHDEFLRKFTDDYHILQLGDIHFGNEFIHQTVNGKNLLVVHGDLFDMVVKYARWLCWIGDIGYEILLWTNKIVNCFSKLFSRRHWSLSKTIKRNVKKAVNYVSDFEQCLTKYGKEKNCDGCVCGHIHSADLKVLKDGFLYINTGDWVESSTAIIEYEDGELVLYHAHS